MAGLNLIFDGRLGLYVCTLYRCQGLVHGGKVFKRPQQLQFPPLAITIDKVMKAILKRDVPAIL